MRPFGNGLMSFAIAWIFMASGDISVSGATGIAHPINVT